jgi:hypothetical protein
MQKLKAARLAGFVGALGASAVPLRAAANTTGAYFTDKEDGAIFAKSGSLTADRNSDYPRTDDDACQMTRCRPRRWPDAHPVNRPPTTVTRGDPGVTDKHPMSEERARVTSAGGPSPQ